MITDEKVKKLVNRLGIPELAESLDTFPENERDGRTDMELYIEEVRYFYELFTSCDTVFSEDIQDAKEILSKTKYGKVMPIVQFSDGSIRPRWKESDVINAKNAMNELKRLERAYKKYCM